MEWEIRDQCKSQSKFQRRPCNCIYTRCRRALQGDCPGSGSCLQIYDESQYDRCYLGWKCCSRSRKYRRLCSNACYGRKSRFIQGIRWSQCSSDLPWYPGYRGDHSHNRQHCSGIWRHQSGRYLCSEMFWNWGEFKRTPWYPGISRWPAWNCHCCPCRHHQCAESNR